MTNLLEYAINRMTEICSAFDVAQVIYDRPIVRNNFANGEGIFCYIDEVESGALSVASYSGVMATFDLTVGFAKSVDLQQPEIDRREIMVEAHNLCVKLLNAIQQTSDFRIIGDARFRKIEENESTCNAVGYDVSFSVELAIPDASC